MIAPDYEKGLALLKAYIESLPVHDYSEVSIVDTPSQPLYSYTITINPDEDIAKAIGSAFAKLVSFTTSKKIEMTGSPRVIILNNDEDIFQFQAAIPVNKNEELDQNQQIVAIDSYHGKAVKIIHRGSYNRFNESYDILESYLNDHNLKKNGHIWEDYVTDPGHVKEADLITHIFQPIEN